ncbi:MAG: RloB domain-containing protein [Rhodocyclaceae bacterium]|jgi:hypothetical protein
MAKRSLRKTNRTVLVVVEGETEEAFLEHIKRLYYRRGTHLIVSIKNAHGHGPQGVIEKLKSVAKTADFDRRIAVLDADIPLKATEEKWLRKEKVETLISIPAIEASLLTILGRHPPNVTHACKSTLQKHAPGDPTDARYYARHFPLAVLEQARSTFPLLDALVAAVSTG